jgi:hypothetical protein
MLPTFGCAAVSGDFAAGFSPLHEVLSTHSLQQGEALARDASSMYPRRVAFVDQNVLRLDIAVDDVAPMRRSTSAGLR